MALKVHFKTDQNHILIPDSKPNQQLFQNKNSNNVRMRGGSGVNSFDHCAGGLRGIKLDPRSFHYSQSMWRITRYCFAEIEFKVFKCWTVLNFLKIMRILIGQIPWIHCSAEDPFSKGHVPVNTSLVLWRLDGMETHSPLEQTFYSSSLFSLEFSIQAIYNS